MVSPFVAQAIRKTQAVPSYPVIRLTAVPHEVSHRLLTVDPGPVTFPSNVVSSGPPIDEVALREGFKNISSVN